MITTGDRRHQHRRLIATTRAAASSLCPTVSIYSRGKISKRAFPAVRPRHIMKLLLLGIFVAVCCLAMFHEASSQVPPTLYEYYTSGGITEGLKAPRSGFTLNGRPITIYSGALHYFRVHPAYWRDRLRKARAAGLNAVETYAPWNLHEPRMGEYDFGAGGNDLSVMLDVRRFIQMAQEEDLFVLFRPGPYICSEWEFGGLPSWLLRYEGIKVRTSDANFTRHVTQYFNQLLPQVADLSFMNGGPIIALQIENEYGSFGPRDQPRDTAYLELIRDLYRSNGLGNELYFTSDSPVSSGDVGAVPGELQTANFASGATSQFDALLQLQPDKALMAMEFWTGWFDHWMQGYHDSGHTPQKFEDELAAIFSYNASVNFYMFHGGSTFGLMNGANVKAMFPFYEADISSYDYGAPLSEAGDYTEKYNRAKTLIAANNPVETLIPQQPLETVKIAYPSIQVTEYISFSDLISQVPSSDRTTITNINSQSSMENLPFENGNGQSYGIAAYRKVVQTADVNTTLKVMGHVRDIAFVLVDGVQRTSAPTGQGSLAEFGFWPNPDAEMTLTDMVPGQDHALDILVENFARNNFGYPADFLQQKGLWEGPVLLDGVELTDWEVVAMQFKSSWVQRLTGWQAVPGGSVAGPAMFRAVLTIPDAPNDTFLDMRAWGKGFIFVNGFPLGRYFNLGPQLTSFIPAPLLRQGDNEIVVFEEYTSASEFIFTDTPFLGVDKSTIKTT